MGRVRALAVVTVLGLGVALAPVHPVAAAEVPVDPSGCPAGGNPAGALPCVTFELRCDTQGLQVTLANAAAAGADAQFTVSATGGFGTGSTVAPNATVSHTIGFAEEQTQHVTVVETTTSQTFVDRDVTLDCENPSAAVQDVSCANGLTVSLANPGGTTGTRGVDIDVDLYDDSSAVVTRSSGAGDLVGTDDVTFPLESSTTIRAVATLTSGTSPVVLADRTQTIDCAPDITLTTPPDGTTYTRGRTVLADYSCADRGSGVSTCGGDVADNAAIDTSVLGAHTFTVQATDGGGRQRTVVNDYDVVPATCQGHPVTVDLRFGETPTAGPDVIVGTPGADVIRGHGGADVICGWGGKDVIHGGAGRDSIWGGVGNDTLSAGKGGGLLAGQQGADRLNGGQQADALRGGPGADTLHGGLAPDTGDGGPDTDECYLFPGYDVYVDCEIIALP